MDLLLKNKKKYCACHRVIAGEKGKAVKRDQGSQGVIILNRVARENFIKG